MTAHVETRRQVSRRGLGQGSGQGSLFQSVSETDDTRRISATAESGAGPLRQSQARTSMPDARRALALIALLFRALCVLAAFGTTRLIRDALARSRCIITACWEIVLRPMIAGTALPVLAGDPRDDFRDAAPMLRLIATISSRRASIGRRRATGRWLTFGWGAFALVAPAASSAFFS